MLAPEVSGSKRQQRVEGRAAAEPAPAPGPDAPGPAPALNRDLALLRRWNAGDRDAGMELLDHYSALVRLVAFRLGVRDQQGLLDLYQDLVLRVLEALPSLPERVETSFAGWLAWQVRDLAQKRARRLQPASALPEGELAGSSDPADRAATWDAIQSCRDKLPDRERAVFELRYLEGLSLQEVAGRVQSNANAVAQSVFRLVRRMRACLRTQGYELPGAEA
jgi:RNA polymerase sigma-70 factor (ECF subfamily)